MARASKASASRKTAVSTSATKGKVAKSTAAKKRTTTRVNGGTAAKATTAPQSAQVKHLETVLTQQRKEATAVEKKLATVRARVKKARERAQTTKTKASESALIKARSDASELNQQINQLRDDVRETRHKLKTQRLLYSIVEAEQKAEQWLSTTREKLDVQADEQLDKALVRFEVSWMKKKAAQIDRQLKQAEKTAAARVAAIEKKALLQVKALEKKAETVTAVKAAGTSGARTSETEAPEAKPSEKKSPRARASTRKAATAADAVSKPAARRGRPRKNPETPPKAAPKATPRASTTTGKAGVKSVAKAAPRRRGRPPKAAAGTE